MVDTGNPDVVSRIVHEPIGVCGLITPWNYPLLQVSWKVAPCLAAGNTFVLKPSELTPHTAIHLMRLLEEAGLPAGVGNLVLGTGPEAGAPLSTDPRVDLVSFTGGLETGRRIMAAAAGTVKKVALELGGKNPNIVFADADLEVAARLRADRGVPALRPGLLGRRPAGRRGVDPRRVRRRDRGAGRADPARRSVRREGRDRPADQRRAPRQGRGVRRGRDRRGRRAPLRRRPPRRPGAGRRLLLPADRARPLHQRDVGDPERVVRAGAHRRDVPRRGRGGRDRQRQHLRAGRRGLDPGRRQGPAGRGPAADGHGLDQRLPPLRAAGRVGRLQAVRHRPRAGVAGLDEYRETKHVWHNIRPAVQHWFSG